MLRQWPIIDGNGKKRSIGLTPDQIIFIEELEKKKCNIVVRVRGQEYVYCTPVPIKRVLEFTNLSQFNLFIEN